MNNNKWLNELKQVAVGVVIGVLMVYITAMIQPSEVNESAPKLLEPRLLMVEVG
ncbi:hypothetical protein PS870_03925 [Pseudomonas fluorescens]|uniref:Uncharacterized protein n=1 Tax=Pseudomonas fluorescens TaxID=294 RepID=A0A5E7MEG3_PSEFL|nr:hypothetical protein [Pseudomonas fluorescens]VVP23086.1 hypothetical protein PS870_03925 [Pseudomonas fluorescens]VVQ32444.1 hypothetical protein PS947_02940 [Pseudomonas fluorescens]